MSEAPTAPRWRNPWVFGGMTLVVVAVAVYLIDADPTFLFQNAVASLMIAALGVGLGYVGWRRASEGGADHGR